MGQPESGAARVRHRPDSAQLLRQCGDRKQRPHPGHHLLLPGTPLRRGTTGPSVVVVQVELNRISQNYPAIPKNPSCGRHFRRADRSRRAEISGDRQSCRGRHRRSGDLVRPCALLRRRDQSCGAARSGAAVLHHLLGDKQPIEQGDRGVKVEHLQYMLSVLSAYIPEIPPVTIDGIFGSATRSAVIARPAPVWPAGNRYCEFRYLGRNLRPVLRHRNHQLARPGEFPLHRRHHQRNAAQKPVRPIHHPDPVPGESFEHRESGSRKTGGAAMRPLSSFVGQPIRSLQTMLRSLPRMTPPICASSPTAFTARRPPPPSPPSNGSTACR